MLVPVLTLLAAASSAITNRGYRWVALVAGINLLVIFYTYFSGPFQDPNSAIMRLGAAHTLIWFATVASLVGAGLRLGGDQVAKS